MKKIIAVASSLLLASSAVAFAQMQPGSPNMTQKQKEDMARQNPIPGSKSAGSSSPNAPAPAAPGSTVGTGAGPGAGGPGAGGAGGAGGARGAGR